MNRSQYPGEEWSVRTAAIPEQSMFGISTPFMPQDSHTYTLAIISLPQRKSFQRKTLRAENFNMRYYNNARVPPPFHLPNEKNNPTTDLRIRWHLKKLPTRENSERLNVSQEFRGKFSDYPATFWPKKQKKYLVS